MYCDFCDGDLLVFGELREELKDLKKMIEDESEWRGQSVDILEIGRAALEKENKELKEKVDGLEKAMRVFYRFLPANDEGCCSSEYSAEKTFLEDFLTPNE